MCGDNWQYNFNLIFENGHNVEKNVKMLDQMDDLIFRVEIFIRDAVKSLIREGNF